MSGVLYDFEVRQGNTGVCNNPAGLVVRRLQDDGITPIDLTNAVVVFLLNGAVAKDSETGDITFDIATGYIVVPFSVVESDLNGGSSAKYELEVQLAGSERTWYYGKITKIKWAQANA